MGADEVGGQLVLLAKFEKLRHPRVLRRSWTAHFERLIDALDRFDGRTIKLEIVLLFAGPEGL